MRNAIVFVVIFALSFIALKSVNRPPLTEKSTVINVLPTKPQDPPKPEITTVVPPYQSYDEVVAQLKEWHDSAPLLTEVGTYGKSSKGVDIYFLRMTNKNKSGLPKVLVFASIHGNESISTSTTMATIGTMLSKYKDDSEVTELINTRDIYFIPVVSPDSYPSRRWVDGVDPNRDFPSNRDPNHQSVPPVQALRDFHAEHKFKAVVCGHSSGRMYLYPWSERRDDCPHDAQYKDILGDMVAMNGYRIVKSSNLYNSPIVGGGNDWFYRNGALVIAIEYGTHQRKSTHDEIKKELELTFKPLMLYIRRAPLIEVPFNPHR